MADRISRKRLKKKVLDRWENEGGSLSGEETKKTENKTTLPSDDRANDPGDTSDETQAISTK